MKTLLRYAMAGLAIAAVAAGSPAMAETFSFKAELKGSNEVPVNQSKGTGTVTVTYDTASKKLSWKGGHTGLSGPATAAHFHGPAEAGKNAGVVIGIATGGVPAMFEGSATITDGQAADLLAGRWYVNVHTAANPAGEIRGQVTK